MENTPPPITTPQTSGLAITSLVLGILVFCTVGLTAIPAVICGHIALSQIGKSSGRTTGSGLAIGGLVTGYFGLLLLVISVISLLAGIALPVFGEVKERGNLTKALSEAKQIGIACRLYASENEGKFPAKLEDLVPDYLPDPEILACKYPDPKNPVAFEYFGGTDEDEPKKVLLSSPAVPGKGRVFIYVDGSGEAKSRQQLKREN